MRSAPRLHQVRDGWLLARDLHDVHDLPAQRLAHHQVAAHRTWGIGAGLMVFAADGKVGVTPGCALDRCGRLGIASRPTWLPLPEGREVRVVLTVSGTGPAARVLLGETARLGGDEVPLARVDESGEVHTGDSDRSWLRRPGPTITLGGVVPRGAAAEGTACAWTHDVELDRHRLAGAPTVMVTPAGAATGPGRHTFDVSEMSAAGFRIVVRRIVRTDEDPPQGQVNTTPFALSWLAVLPADRAELPPPESWR
jgi:hypothetical protein